MQNKFAVFIETFSYSVEKKDLKFFISSESARNYMTDCENIEAFDTLEDLFKAVNDQKIHLSLINEDELVDMYRVDMIKDLVSSRYGVMFDDSNSILSIKNSVCYYGHQVYPVL